MKMRKKPLRGEKAVHVPSGESVVLLEVVEKHFVKCIFPFGKIDAVAKSSLNLPIIDTAFYEKIHDPA